MSTGDDELPLSRTPRVADDVRSEVEFHVQERAKELEALGTPRDQALAEARTLFGDREIIEAECRTIEKRRRNTQDKRFRAQSLRQDVTIGLRLLRKSPLFTMAAIVTLAIGIGANAAVFSLINQVILQPLGFPEANRLVRITERHENGWGNLTWPTMLDLEKQSKSLAAIASYGSEVQTVLGVGEPLRILNTGVSAGFFSVFGARVERGRLPLPEEHREGANPVVVVSHAFWRDHLGSPASLNGVQVRIDVVYDVIGVLPADFAFPVNSQIWMPLEREQQTTSRTAHNWDVVARLRPGVAPQAAQRELDALIAEMRVRFASDFDATGAIVQPLQDVLTADLRTPLYLLFAASAVLLLAACTNLASAQLARGASRAGELAVRSALGANRLRLIRQLMTESAVLALLGAIAGIGVAKLLLQAFTVTAPPSLRVDTVQIDGWVLLFALTVAMLTALGFGLLPAVRLSDASTALALREGGRATISKSGMRVWNVLVAAEIALAIMLLAGSQALIRSFAQVMRADLGFSGENVATAKIDLPKSAFGDSGATSQFHENALGRLRTMQGISAVGFANRLPLEGNGPSGSLEIEGKPHNANGPYNGYAIYRAVGGEYFQAMGIRVIEGRALGPGDNAGAAKVVVVDQAFATTHWPGQNVIGRRLRSYGMDGTNEEWFTVVGLVSNVRASGVTAPFQSTYYFDYRQRPEYRTRAVTYVARSVLPEASVAAVLRREISAVSTQVPIESGDMTRVLGQAVAVRRFMMLLLGAFASMALVLALVGIYAVVSYTVARRTREIGVRVALGATSSHVLQLVLRSAMHGIVPGLVAGVLLAVIGIRALRSLLYGVSPQDPIALVSAVAILGFVGFVSTVVPARRATRVDPLVAMRAE